MNRIDSPTPRRRVRQRDYDDFRETLAAPAPRTYRRDLSRHSAPDMAPTRPDSYDRALSPAEQVIRIVAGILNTLLVLRFLTSLFSTDTRNPVVNTMFGATDWLVRPLQYLFGTPPQSGGNYLDLPALAMIGIITLTAWIITSLMRDYDLR